jgi:hypothetical protein
MMELVDLLWICVQFIQVAQITNCLINAQMDLVKAKSQIVLIFTQFLLTQELLLILLQTLLIQIPSIYSLVKLGKKYAKMEFAGKNVQNIMDVLMNFHYYVRQEFASKLYQNVLVSRIALSTLLLGASMVLV